MKNQGLGTRLSCAWAGRKSFCLVLALYFFTNISYATDRIVQETGVGGAYTTINAALTAAVAGDRILIVPKSGGDSYDENITVNKQNLKMLSTIQGTRFILRGNFTNFSNLLLSNAEIIGNTFATGYNQHFINCLFRGHVQTESNDASATYMDHDSILNGYVQISRGRISGCYIESYDGPCIKSLAYNSFDSLIIVGNTCIIHDSVPVGILFSSAATWAHIWNNFVLVYNTGSTAGGYGIQLATAKWPGQVNTCYNNTVFVAFGSDVTAGISAQYHYSPFNMQNNAVFTLGAPGYEFDSASAAITTFKYNYGTYGFTGIQADATNNGTSAIGIDGGNPSNLFLDPDKSRNDAGCNGGPYSINNFISNSSNARVLYMSMPRQVMVNQTFRVVGDGSAK